MTVYNESGTEAETPSAPTFAEATKVWAKIGCLSFGGPAGQIALMHKELVEERRWISEERFLHALNYCMLLPGPEAQQLAIYIGWLLHRTIGGLVAGLLFIIPGALVMLALCIMFVTYRNLPAIDAAFLGVKAAVLAVVVEAVIRISKRALKNQAMISIAALSFIGIYFLQLPFPLIIGLAALAGWFGQSIAPELFKSGGHAASGDTPAFKGVIDQMFDRGELDHAQPSASRTFKVLALWLFIWIVPLLLVVATTGTASIWTHIGMFFSAMAVVTFGGAYAVLAYVAQAAVETYGWLAPSEMVDGLGLAETTPGPLILVLQFVGFLAAYRSPGGLDPLWAGTLGAMLILWVTFAPCFLWIFVGAPYAEHLRGQKAISAALSAITAAVVGVVLNLALWFGLHVIFTRVTNVKFGFLDFEIPNFLSINWLAALLSALAMIMMLRFKIGMIYTLAICAALAVAVRSIS
jgi:chromate transporter